MFTDPKSMIETLALIVLGIFAVISLIDRGLTNRKFQMDQQEDRVITLLKEEVQAMKGKYDDLHKQFQDQSLRFEQLSTENKTLREILQGRDQATLEYQKAGLASMKNGEKVLEISISNSQDIKRLAGLMERHINQFDKFIQMKA